jgi:hypothetical protein
MNASINSLEYARRLWDAAKSFGIHSEKASHHGHAGIGHERFATVATGETVYATIAPLYANGRMPSVKTRAMVLDADAVLRANGGRWPPTEAELRAILQRRPECVIADVTAKKPPETFAIEGVPKGTRMVIYTGVTENGDRAPPSMANVLNASQIPPELRGFVDLKSKTDGELFAELMKLIEER